MGKMQGSGQFKMGGVLGGANIITALLFFWGQLCMQSESWRVNWRVIALSPSISLYSTLEPRWLLLHVLWCTCTFVHVSHDSESTTCMSKCVTVYSPQT